MDINIGVLEVEVLITPVRFEIHNQPWLLRSHLSSFLHSRDCKLTTMGVWKMGAQACVSIFWVTISSWIQMPWNSWHSPHKGSHVPLLTSTKWAEKPYSTSWLGALAKMPGKGLALATLPSAESVKLFRPPSMSDAWHRMTKLCINV